MAPNKNDVVTSVKRVRAWYGLLVCLLAVFVVRLFYVQVINHNHYRVAALSAQLKQYEIPATRGTIEAYENGQTIPLVLNQKLYVLYADPTFIKKPDEAALKVAGVIGGDTSRYAELMRTKNSRYVILAKKLTPDQSQQIAKLKLAGVGTQAQDYRTYPQGSLAAHVLGFVNNEGKGINGVEQALNKQLTGTPGQMKAITDASGVPLAASRDNTLIEPKNGDKVVLTLDLAMQQQLEAILAKGLQHAKATTGSALILDIKTGAVKAMANLPTYDPAQYFNVEDPTVFQNFAVSHPIEVGSTMKPLTTAAALDTGAIRANQTYYDPSFWMVDKFRISNIEEDGGAGTRSITDILNLSLNTGATWELMQMGGGEINLKARQTWYNYMSNHFRFGKATGIEQGYEEPGLIPRPEENGAGIDLTYANTSFGQAMTATPIQMGAALAAVVNGGTYYQPRLVDRTIGADGQVNIKKPKVLKTGVVRPQTGQDIIPMMRHTVDTHAFRPGFDQDNYMVGGKTGTAQIAKPGGGYYDDQFNGTYMGFVGGDQPEYVIVVFVHRPKIAGYAGSQAAQPIFGDLAHMLINNSYVLPKKQ